jgi:hypothetical protein
MIASGQRAIFWTIAISSTCWSANELVQLAKEKGFADSLTKTVHGYGGVTAYVKHLMWEAEFRAARNS